MCEIRRGGYFVETKSTIFNKSSDLVAAGGSSSELNTSSIELGVSKLLSTSLAGVETLTLPIGILRLRWGNGYTIRTRANLLSCGPCLSQLSCAWLEALRSCTAHHTCTEERAIRVRLGINNTVFRDIMSYHEGAGTCIGVLDIWISEITLHIVTCIY